MAMMANDGPSPLPPSLRLGLDAHQPLKRPYARFLLGPLFHDSRTPHVFESRWWATTYCRLPLRSSPHDVAFESWNISALICLNHAPSWFYFTLAESQNPNLWTYVCVFSTSSSSAFAFLVEMDFSFESLFAIKLVVITTAIPLFLLL